MNLTGATSLFPCELRPGRLISSAPLVGFGCEPEAHPFLAFASLLSLPSVAGMEGSNVQFAPLQNLFARGSNHV